MDNQDFLEYLSTRYSLLKDLNYQKKSLISRIWIKNAPKCKSQIKKPQKMIPKWTGIQTQVRHPKAPFSTFQMLIGTNVGHGPRALGLR